MKINLESFSIIGIAIRTSNANEMGPNGVISKQWNRFMQEDILKKIPNKSDDAIIAGYTEYQSNKDGDYTFIIGAKVKSTDSIPEGMVAKNVPAGNYLILTSQKGPIWEVVLALWIKIWNMPTGDAGSESQRTYKFDYEIYDKRAQDPKNAQIDVYLGIKNEDH